MLSRDPGELKILSMTNYKTLVRCKGYSSRGSGLGLGASDGQQADSRWNCLYSSTPIIFYIPSHRVVGGALIRSSFSADGQFIICGMASSVGYTTDSTLFRLT